jgi:hypothetical protein
MTLSFVAASDAGRRASIGCAVLAALAVALPDILDRLLELRCHVRTASDHVDISTRALQGLQTRLPFDHDGEIDSAARCEKGSIHRDARAGREAANALPRQGTLLAEPLDVAREPGNP